MSRKGVFIPDITVEMFKKATLESVEEFMVSGQMEDIEIPERPHGEWVRDFNKDSATVCSECGEKAWYKEYCGWVTKSNFCPTCGADMRKEGDKE